MNRVDLIGNLCKDVEVRYSAGENPTATLMNTIAVQRKFKNRDTNQYESDFITIKAFSHTAEFIGKYFRKGSKIAVSGRIQTGSYKNKDGQTIYTTDVIVEDAEFADSKASSGQDNNMPQPQEASAYAFINEGIDGDQLNAELPFK